MQNRELRVVFMGTPAFAVASLRALLRPQEDPGPAARVVGVFTQPDRPAGRHGVVTPPPVKEEALAAGIPVFQPERLRSPEGFAMLESAAPDLIVVAAYAHILPRRVLELPRYGCLNVHASLLPLYRGASPISAAIMDGQTRSGVSIILMEVGLDTG
ncbi:MAG TPA: methionyl-tRNA formyltransferase, partial [Chloroflexota bacterium]|nr:methionyl-tRNA formyltransferase [Chloroflexota bacterium]